MRSIIRISNQANFPGSSDSAFKKKNTNSKNSLPLTTQKNMISETEQKFKSLENLVKMIVHEIRNPLTSIALANQLMREVINDGLTATTLNVYSDLISKNVSRIEELLKDLLFESPLEGLEFAPVNMHHVIETSLEKANDRIFLKELQVVKDYDQDILIEGNAEKLSLAFLNLIVNAIEATKKGEGKIWITAYRMNDEVKVIVTDNGTGMEPEVANHMFDRNFSCKSKGLGVGLVHVKQILEWHKAMVSVISEPGTGTSVIVAFKAIECN
jgi:signal transduction histidine kinase